MLRICTLCLKNTVLRDTKCVKKLTKTIAFLGKKPGLFYFWDQFFLGSTKKGSTYPDLQFLGNFREKSKKFPTPTVSKKLSEISPNFPKKLRALLPDLQLRTGNFCRF